MIIRPLKGRRPGVSTHPPLPTPESKLANDIFLTGMELGDFPGSLGASERATHQTILGLNTDGERPVTSISRHRLSSSGRTGTSAEIGGSNQRGRTAMPPTRQGGYAR